MTIKTIKEEEMSEPDLADLGRTVMYRSKTGSYTCPAIVTATLDSLYQPNVDAGHVGALSSPDHVHLTVLTPGIPGEVSAETRQSHPELASDDRPNKPAGGTYQEQDIPKWWPQDAETYDRWHRQGDYSVQEPGTWAWPPRK